MESIFILSPAETMTLDQVKTLAESQGYRGYKHKLKSKDLITLVYDEGEIRGKEIWPTYQIDLEAERRAGFLEGVSAFNERELAELEKLGIRSCIQIDCHLEAIPLMRSLLRAILENWGGFVIYEDLDVRYSKDELMDFNPHY